MNRFLSLIIFCFVASMGLQTHAAEGTSTTKAERKFIAEGNKLYRDGSFQNAEVQYRKALEENGASEIAMFNLAASLLKQGGSMTADGPNDSMKEAMQLLNQLNSAAKNLKLAELSAYNLGNVAFNAQQYQQAIEHYKQALRRNPDNEQARQNLRLAQRKLENQNNDNQDKNDNQDQDKQDTNDNKNEQSPDNQDNSQNQQNEQKQNQEQQNQGINSSNAEQILKAMENQEKAVRARVNAEKEKEKNAASRGVIKPW